MDEFTGEAFSSTLHTVPAECNVHICSRKLLNIFSRFRQNMDFLKRCLKKKPPI